MLAKRKVKNQSIQKPFRISAEFDSRLNKAKGAFMMETGSRISDNQFIIDLLELGLQKLPEKLQR